MRRRIPALLAIPMLLAACSHALPAAPVSTSSAAGQAAITAVAGPSLAGASAAADGSKGSPLVGTPAPLKLAVQGPLSGPSANLGKAALQAVQLATDRFNSRAGDAVRLSVEVVPVDDRATVAGDSRLAGEVAADPRVLAVVGPMKSAVCLAAGPTYDRAGLSWISQACSNVKVTESGWKTAHRLVARDDAQGPADAIFLRDDPINAKRLFVLDSQTVYSVSLADEVQKKAEALGVTTQRAGLQTAITNYSAELDRIKAFNPDVLFFADEGPEVPAILQAGKKAGGSWKFMSGDAAFDATQVIEGSQGAAEGAFVSFVVPDFRRSSSGRQFLQDYQSRFGEPPATFAAEAYDAANIVLQSITAAAKTARSPVPTRADVNLELARTRDYPGLAGPITFDAKGDLVGQPIFIYQVNGREFKQVTVITSR